MRSIIAAVVLYLAFVLQIATSHSAAGGWGPNIVLLAGIVAARRLGIGWAAAAGLLCDALTGRPLGVTMLAATLTVTIGRYLLPTERAATPVHGIAAIFVSVFVVELQARLLAGSVSPQFDVSREVLTSLRVGLATACVAAGLTLVSMMAMAVWNRFSGRTRSSWLTE